MLLPVRGTESCLETTERKNPHRPVLLPHIPYPVGIDIVLPIAPSLIAANLTHPAAHLSCLVPSFNRCVRSKLQTSYSTHRVLSGKTGRCTGRPLAVDSNKYRACRHISGGLGNSVLWCLVGSICLQDRRKNGRSFLVSWARQC